MNVVPNETQFDRVEHLTQAALKVIDNTKQHDNYRTLVLTASLDALSEALAAMGI